MPEGGIGAGGWHTPVSAGVSGRAVEEGSCRHSQVPGNGAWGGGHPFSKSEEIRRGHLGVSGGDVPASPRAQKNVDIRPEK